MTVRAAEIARFLNLPLRGADLSVAQPASLTRCCPGSVVFATRLDEHLAQRLNGEPLLAIVTAAGAERLTGAHIVSAHPRRDFALVLRRFFAARPAAAVSVTAKIGLRVEIGRDVHIGEQAVIGEEVRIGDGARIGDHAVIEAGSVIGACCVIEPHVVVGQAGFGLEKDEAGAPLRIPHFGRVVIGDEVEIGSFTSIDRATLDETVIQAGTKIDKHVYIAHNVHIGRRCIIAAGVRVLGSVQVGDDVWLGAGCMIRETRRVGDKAVIGMGAVVVGDVAEGVTVVGNPAGPLRR